MASNPIPLIGAAVDRLGQIKAQIAELEVAKKALEARIIADDEDVIEGALFRATVVRTAESTSLDPKAAEAKLRELGVDGRWFSKNQKVRKASVSLRVTARKGE